MACHAANLDAPPSAPWHPARSLDADAPLVGESGAAASARPIWQARAVTADPGKLLLLDTPSLYFRAFFGVPDTMTGAGRHPDQRRARAARLHRPAGHRPAAADGWSRRWTTTGGRPSGSTRCRRTRRTGWPPADEEEVPDALSPQVADHRGRARGARRRLLRGRRLRGRRRDRHPRDPRPRAGRRRDRRPRPVPAGRRRRARCGSSTPPAGSAAPTSSTRRRWPRSTASPAARTPTSRRCAATRATACPASPGVGDKTAAALITKYGSLPALLDALDAGDTAMPAGARTKLAARRATTWRSPRRSSRWPRTCRCRRTTTASRPARGTRTGWSSCRSAGGWTARSTGCCRRSPRCTRTD